MAISDERRRIEALRAEVIELARDDETDLDDVLSRQRAEEALLSDYYDVRLHQRHGGQLAYG